MRIKCSFKKHKLFVAPSINYRAKTERSTSRKRNVFFVERRIAESLSKAVIFIRWVYDKKKAEKKKLRKKNKLFKDRTKKMCKCLVTNKVWHEVRENNLNRFWVEKKNKKIKR